MKLVKRFALARPNGVTVEFVGASEAPLFESEQAALDHAAEYPWCYRFVTVLPVYMGAEIAERHTSKPEKPDA